MASFFSLSLSFTYRGQFANQHYSAYQTYKYYLGGMLRGHMFKFSLLKPDQSSHNLLARRQLGEQ